MATVSKFMKKFDVFAKDLASGVHQLQTGTAHVYKVMLTNTSPVKTNTVKANITEIAAGNGYTAGGNSIGTITGALVAGTGLFTFVGGTDVVWTASGGSIGPFRYVVLYNDTPASPLDPLIGWWDGVTTITLAAADTFTFDMDQTNGILTIA